MAGSAVFAPTAAAPTAVFCRKLRLDILDFFALAIRFPCVRVREENSSRTFSGPPDRLEGYFDMCNIACYNTRRSTGPRQSSRPDRRSDPTGEKTHIRWPHLLQNSASSVSTYPQLRHFTRMSETATPEAPKPASRRPAPNAVAAA